VGGGVVENQVDIEGGGDLGVDSSQERQELGGPTQLRAKQSPNAAGGLRIVCVPWRADASLLGCRTPQTYVAH
jgi:hypothetical protein